MAVGKAGMPCRKGVGGIPPALPTRAAGLIAASRLQVRSSQKPARCALEPVPRSVPAVAEFELVVNRHVLVLHVREPRRRHDSDQLIQRECEFTGCLRVGFVPGRQP